ncbi:hypothetical protein DR950_36085 [Kitasatospora xanthocidica]|uniref:Phage tail family protein n=1 Tax=Kitasatospora xanthocidica TaxID=83382 RepID=A0A373A4G1_9ACTN|nr:hypothetical protein DR950_36085 [Kitasatospora xanthocidica]
MPIPAKYSEFPEPGGLNKGPYAPVKWPHTYVTWTSANGDVIPLTGDISGRRPAGLAVQWGPSGFDLPTYDLHADQLPNMDGAMFRTTRATSRDVTIPLYIRGLDRKSLITMKNRLFSALNPHAGPGLLTVRDGDLPARHLKCFYVSGLEGNETQESAGFLHIRYALILRAMDPYWYSNSENQFDWSLKSSDVGSFLSPPKDLHRKFLNPLRIGSASLGPEGVVEVNNPSSVESWPVWSISGRATGLKVLNKTTGKSFAFSSNYTVPDDQVATVDTRPGFKNVALDDGTNLWPHLAPNPALWALAPGRNIVQVEGGDYDDKTLIRLHFTPRYLSYTGG